jgi:diketogulonate reductase-like aldo/keto reductase
MVQKIKLNDGNEMPVVALGTWELRGDDGYKAVLVSKRP